MSKKVTKKDLDPILVSEIESSVSKWVDIEEKPLEFPPSTHEHTIEQVEGLQEALDSSSGAAGINLVPNDYEVIATTASQKDFTIPLTTFDIAKGHILSVVQNRTTLSPFVDYTVSGRVITLTTGVAVGTTLYLRVLSTVASDVPNPIPIDRVIGLQDALDGAGGDVPLATDTVAGIFKVTTNKFISNSTDFVPTLKIVQEYNENRIYEIEQKANKIQENDILATLQNGWMHNVPQDLRFFKDNFGIVHLTGSIYGGTKTLPTIVTTLPVGYRPKRAFEFITGPASTETIFGKLHIKVDGNIMIMGSAINSYAFAVTFYAGY